MAHPFVYVELHSRRGPESADFFRKLLGWKVSEEAMPGGVYTMLAPGDGVGGGIAPDAGPTAEWLPYVGVDDVDAMVRRAEQLGAKVLKGRTEVPGAGVYAVVADPTGTPLAFWHEK